VVRKSTKLYKGHDKSGYHGRDPLSKRCLAKLYGGIESRPRMITNRDEGTGVNRNG